MIEERLLTVLPGDVMKIIIPTAFRKFTGGQSIVHVDGECVSDGVENLIALHPDLRQSLLEDSGDLVSFVAVFVGDRNIRDLQGAQTRVSDHDELLLVPAIAGG